ncbi:hypothetical protein [Amycolatopsis sp. Poz14]|uniref:hypothetical protein n=1 Tax=Amycolatopsis sp. Poz14 TaxID=1447705 RepID=UPI001EE97737|nr:hypothetical protein [Amycolatopsis sp. Poz14]MCG3750476.1 hypothetical protein [Amycolatopsis sp. Poz14]
MPRRRPSQLRVRESPYPQPGPPYAQVPCVSSSTLRAIAHYERTHLYPGGIAEALAVWTRLVHASYRELDRHPPEDHVPYYGEYGPATDPVSARARLGQALHRLPRNASRELRARVRPLDERYLSRSIPAPEVQHLRALP